ncbi:MAG: AMIN domain-containing protein [Saccharospirillaceae bacterium]|nr:AMIN domain-containing protein [Pseudomonadales bacterium]NRB80462.1 AMIN domain-containing protein [Saccharospirillaceae bacterium]
MNAFFKHNVFVILSCFLSFSAMAASNKVKDLRISNTTDSVRVVLDLSSAFDYKIFTMPNPNRVIIDLKSTKLDTNIKQPDTNKTNIESIRSAIQKNNDLRIVFDLKSKMSVSSFVLAPQGNKQHRLVLDLKTATATAASHKSVSQINKGKRDVIIAIDAGHGGTDVGAVGSVLLEKNVVFAIAKEVKIIIEQVQG